MSVKRTIPVPATWLIPLSLAILIGCAQQPPQPVAQPKPAPTVPSAPATSIPSTLTLTLGAADAEVSADHFVTVSLILKAQNASLKAVEVGLKFNPQELNFVGLQASDGGLMEASQGEDGQALLTAILNDGVGALTLQAVFQLKETAPASVTANVQGALDQRGRSATPAAQAEFKVVPGTGGEATSPKLTPLDAQVLTMQQRRGLVSPQAAKASDLQVPAVPDATWLNFEAGDVNQDGKVDLADTAKLANILLGADIPTPYQAYAADLFDQAVDGKQVLNTADFAAMLLKRGLMIFRAKVALPTLHPLSVNANTAQTALLMVGNAGNGPLNVQASADQPWISVQPLTPTTGVNTLAFKVSADSAAGSTGNVILTFPGGLKRTVPVTALAPAPMPNSVVGQYNAVIESAFSALTFTRSSGAGLNITATNPVWDAGSHVFSAEVTLDNTS